MIITGSAVLIRPGSFPEVIRQFERFPEVTFHAQSESGAELVVNLEAPDSAELEFLCDRLMSDIPEIVDITHIYINFEDEVEGASKLGN